MDIIRLLIPILGGFLCVKANTGKHCFIPFFLFLGGRGVCGGEGTPPPTHLSFYRNTILSVYPSFLERIGAPVCHINLDAITDDLFTYH